MYNFSVLILSMSKLTPEQVKKIAMLARLELTEAEVEKFSGQLTNILEWVEMLNQLDTDGVEPTAQVTGLVNVSEPDEVQNYVENKEELLECTPLEVKARQILVKSVL